MEGGGGSAATLSLPPVRLWKRDFNLFMPPSFSNAGSDPIDLPPPLLDDGIVETNKDPADSTVHPSRDTSQPIILQDNENLI